MAVEAALAPIATAPGAPEPSSPFRSGLAPVRAHRMMAISAHPLASQAGLEVLQAGGSAVDAAIAIQLVLGLVEPQSSGIGGGAFLLHYDAASGRLQTYDGREAAPAAAHRDYFEAALHAGAKTEARIPSQPGASPLADREAAFARIRGSGRSIGTPGVIRMLELAHQDYGKLPWAHSFQPAIDLAIKGFPIGPRLAAAIRSAQVQLARDADASAYFLAPDGEPKTAGTWLQNQAYAATLRAISDSGADAFYRGPIAQAIVQKIRSSTHPEITPGLTTLTDLGSYRAIRREPICAPYRSTVVCGVGPPSSGGIAVAQTLGILETFDLAALAPTAVGADGGVPIPLAVHLVSEAQRLAYADRNAYIADPDYVPLPGKGAVSLLDPDYLGARARLISPSSTMRFARPGVFPNTQAFGLSDTQDSGTSHLSIVDAAGNVVVMTSSIEGSLGSYHFTNGFLLNNQLTDFSFLAADESGPIANRIAPGKRPRSSMAPTLVFKRNDRGERGEFVLATGSPGGAFIIQYVVKTIVAALDWKLDAQQASSMVNFGAFNGPMTFIGAEHPAFNGHESDPAKALEQALNDLGHRVSLAAQPSGVATIVLTADPENPSRGVYVGGVDPRREGSALGERNPAR